MLFILLILLFLVVFVLCCLCVFSSKLSRKEEMEKLRNEEMGNRKTDRV